MAGSNNTPTPNKKQLTAITHPPGPLMILAGAGTGKTLMAVQRAKEFSQQGKKVLILTHSRTLPIDLRKKYFNNESKITFLRAKKIINTALKNKINFFDTAYDYGKSEKFIGENLKNKNNYICSKLKNISVYPRHSLVAR